MHGGVFLAYITLILLVLVILGSFKLSFILFLLLYFNPLPVFPLIIHSSRTIFLLLSSPKFLQMLLLYPNSINALFLISNYLFFLLLLLESFLYFLLTALLINSIDLILLSLRIDFNCLNLILSFMIIIDLLNPTSLILLLTV